MLLSVNWFFFALSGSVWPVLNLSVCYCISLMRLCQEFFHGAFSKREEVSGFGVQGSGFRVQGCGGSFAAIYMGDARRFLGKQVSHLSVSAMILLTANDKDFSLRSK